MEYQVFICFERFYYLKIDPKDVWILKRNIFFCIQDSENSKFQVDPSIENIENACKRASREWTSMIFRCCILVGENFVSRYVD